MSEQQTAAPTPSQATSAWMNALAEAGPIEPPKTESAPAEQPPAEQPKDTDGKTTPQQSPDNAAGAKPAPAVPTRTVADPKAAEAKPEAKGAEPPKEDADKWPRSAQEWKHFREVRAKEKADLQAAIGALEKERDEIKAKLTQTPKTSPEFEALKKERDELSDRLRLVDVEKHPKFKAYFDSKTATQLELAKRIVGPEHAENAAKLLQLPDGAYKDAQIEELLVNLTPIQQSRFGSVLNALAEVESERQSEISKARENFDKMQAETAATREAQVKALEKSFETAALKAQESNPVFKKREGDHAWNSEVEKRLEAAKNLFFGKDVKAEQVIQASLDAAAYHAVLSGYDALFAENEQLKAQVTELSKATPRLETGKRESGDTPQPVPIKQGMRPQEATLAWMKTITGD